MRAKVTKFLALLLFTALTLISCLNFEELQNASPSPTNAMTETAILTNTATVTAIPSLTYTPTAEPTKTPEVTWTPLSTLSEAEAFDLVDDLHRNNAGCRLPCLWGITPGTTTWNEANHFFASFASEIKLGFRPSSNGVLYDIRGGNSGAIAFILANNDIITMIQTYRPTTHYMGQLDFLLREYGKPEQIFIKTYDHLPESPVSFTLIIYYEEQRIFALYEYEGFLKDGNVQACPSSEGAKTIIFWAEDVEFNVQEIDPEIYGAAPPTNLRYLEEVTDYTITSFHQLFSDPIYANCIETPAEHW